MEKFLSQMYGYQKELQLKIEREKKIKEMEEKLKEDDDIFDNVDIEKEV